MQGVEDGGLLTVAAGVDDIPPAGLRRRGRGHGRRRRARPQAVGAAAGRRTALTAAALLLGLGAFALLLQRGSAVARAAAVNRRAAGGRRHRPVRAQREREASICLAWMGAAYAAVAGRLLAPAGDLFGLPLAAAGVGAMIAGAVALVGLDAGRALIIPAIVVGSIFAAGGPGDEVAEFDPAVVFTTVLVLVVSPAACCRGSRWVRPAPGSTRSTPCRHHQRTRPIDPTVVREDALVGTRSCSRSPRTVGCPAGPDRTAGGLPRLFGHPGRDPALRGGHAAHPPVPHRPRGPGRPRLRHPRAAHHRRARSSSSTRPGSPRWPWCWPRQVRSCSRRPCCRVPRRCAAAASAMSPSRSLVALCRSWCWPSASSTRSGADRACPPSVTSSRRTPSAGAASSPLSSAAPPADARSSRSARVGPSSAASRWPCC